MIDEYTNGAGFEATLSGRRQTKASRWPANLMYHAIARVSDDPNRVCVTPQRFEAQMRYLKRHGLQGVSMREFLQAAGTERAKRLVALTFDDGYENFLYDAVPILERYGFSATVFVVAGMMGAENSWDERPRMKLLGPEGVREAARRGMEIGAHGMSHVRLAGLPPAQLEEEIGESRRVLGEVLDEPVEGFCYPYGSLDGAATQFARHAGYSYACACWIRTESSIYDLPRPPVWELDGPLMLAAKLKLFPRYFEVAGTSTQKTVNEVGELVYRGMKHIMHAVSKR